MAEGRCRCRNVERRLSCAVVSALALILSIVAALPHVVDAQERAEPVRVVMLIRSSQIMPDVRRAFEAAHGGSRLDLVVTTDKDDPSVLRGAHVVFVEHGGIETLPRWKPEAEAAAARGAGVYSDLPDNIQRLWGISIDPARNEQLLAYWQHGGEANLVSMLAWMYRDGGGTGIDVPAVVPEIREGAYHPAASARFTTLAEYLEWYRATRPDYADKPLVGVTFFHTSLKSGDVAHVDALIASLEQHGMAAVGLFGWPLSTMDEVLDTDDAGQALQLILAFNLSLTRPDDAPALARRGLHVMGLMTTRESYETWAESPRGIAPDRLSTQINSPEMAGATEPILVATSEPVADSPLPKTTPIAERIDMTARRARRWIALRERPNEDKRLVMLYYNNPPGKGNLGASYLNLPPSIVAALKTLGEAGYDIGQRLPDATTLLQLLERSGRNIELWAPGELARLVEDGQVMLVPLEQYREWFDALPERFRTFVVERWGPPEASTLMTWVDARGRRSFVIPGVRLGKVFLGPQLLRTSFDEYTNVQHSGTLPPPHAYIASYLWYRHALQADAVIHMGRHGTLEWLPGKNAGQAGWDSSEVLLGDLPNVNYYIMDGGGEALQARRRSAAVLISHLTPLLVSGGSPSQFDALDEALDEYNTVKDASPLLAEREREKVVAEIRKLGIDRQLGITLDGDSATPFDEVVERVHTFLESVEEAPVPMGLPTFGQLPRDDIQREAMVAFLRSAFEVDELAQIESRVPAWVDELFAGRMPSAHGERARLDPRLDEKAGNALAEAADWLRHLKESPGRELESLPRVLAGQFLPSGPVGDPLRTPAALPSGRNLHGMDPALIPTRTAWDVGRKLGQQFIERFRKEHAGRTPERISMVLWHGESMRHQGVMESEALWLMGVEPMWNPRGVAEQVRLIPDEELGRPRVDVTFTVSGLYRDGLADKILLLDRAAKLVAAAGENTITRNNRRTAEALQAAGLSAEEAVAMAQGRVFATAPGTYGFGLQQMAERSRDFGREQEMADLYLNRMNYVFSGDTWGRQVPKLLESQLTGNEAVIHSRSSNLYGVTDNDDFYQYVGGLNLATRSVNDGAAPNLFLNNLRAGGRERVEDMRTALVTELTSRNWNDKWLREMQEAGYSGAREMMRDLEFLYGWQATSPEIVDGALWQRSYDVYVADEHGLDMAQFFDTHNPHAYQAMVARLLEVDRQGRHHFTTAERGRLVEQYVRSVNAHGAACNANTCGNADLHGHLMNQAPLVSGLGDTDWREFGRTMGRATGWTARQFPTAPVAVRAGLAAANPRRLTSTPAPPPDVPPDAPPSPPEVTGFKMTEQTLTLPGTDIVSGAPHVDARTFVVMWGLLLLGVARGLAPARQ